MELLDFLVREAFITDLPATTKEEAIREIVRTVQDVGYLAAVDTQTLTDSFMEREALGSTGIGKGVACPHGGHKTVDHPFGTVAISRSGVTFDAVDGGLVYVIFLLFHTADQFSGRPIKPGDIYDAFHAIASLHKDDCLIDRLRVCQTREEIANVLLNLSADFPDARASTARAI